MKLYKKLFFSFIIFAVLLPFLEWYYSAAVGLSITVFINLLMSFGRKLPIFEILENVVCIMGLISPIVCYNYNLLLDKYKMAVPPEQYYGYMIPAVVLFIAGLSLALRGAALNSPDLIKRLKIFAQNEPTLGLKLIYFAIPFDLLTDVFPIEIKNIAAVFADLLYVGLTLIIVGGVKRSIRLRAYGIFFILTFYKIAVTGMFTEIAWWSLFIGGIVLMTRPQLTMWKKVAFSLFGFIFIFFIQSLKNDFRDKAWAEVKTGNQIDNSTLLKAIISDRITDPRIFLGEENVYNTVSRLNQGINTSLVMRYIPDVQPYGYGENLYITLKASLIPRFMWPDKPLGSGYENMKRFAGIELQGNNSTNIGTFGEAYGNFGAFGGMIFMFFYGLFFNLVLSQLLIVCIRKPDLFAWLPFIFISILSIETDILANVNTLVKGLMFTFVFFRVYSFVFKVDKQFKASLGVAIR